MTAREQIKYCSSTVAPAAAKSGPKIADGHNMRIYSVSFISGRKVNNCKFSYFIITIIKNISLKSWKVEVFRQPTEERNRANPTASHTTNSLVRTNLFVCTSTERPPANASTVHHKLQYTVAMLINDAVPWTAASPSSYRVHYMHISY